MTFFNSAIRSLWSYSLGMPIVVVRSFGPTKTAWTPGMEQIASRFSIPAKDSIMGMKTVSAQRTLVM